MNMKFKATLLGLSIAAVLPTMNMAQIPVYLATSKPIEERVKDALSRMTLEEKVKMTHAQSKFSSPGVPRLGIPEVWATDGPHGIRPEVLWDEWDQAGWTNDSCIAYPALTCLSATWNPEMSYLYGKSIGEEARYRKKDILLGPGVNIYRTPLNGRNFEYMGEDPYLSSMMVVPYIKGVQENGVAACVKHYALNNQEFNRHTTNVQLSDRALYEIYLPAFKAAVQEGGTWSIMGSYNLYQGQHACHNKRLLKDILRDEWGFDGVVVSDWGGVHNTEQAIHNGMDLEFGSWTNGLSAGTRNAYDNYYLAFPYLKLIKEGKVGTKELDEKVSNVLRLIFRTSMDPHKPFGSLGSPEHGQAGRQIGEEGIVLLQNNGNLLPIDLNKAKKIAVIGAGPSGLSVAVRLNAKGYEVTLFDSKPMPGGLLRYGIPNFKLDKAVIDRRMKILKAEGILFKMGVHVDVQKLPVGFDAYAICTGTPTARDLSIPGRELKGIYFALDMLAQQNHILDGDTFPKQILQYLLDITDTEQLRYKFIYQCLIVVLDIINQVLYILSRQKLIKVLLDNLCQMCCNDRWWINNGIAK